MDLKSFGHYLRRLRMSQGLTIRDVSQHSGVSSPYLSQIERGERRPSPDILKRLAPLYGVSLKHLLEQVGHLEEPPAELTEEEEVERAFQYVVTDPRFRFGTRPEGKELTLEAKRFIVQMYEKMTGKRLLE